MIQDKWVFELAIEKDLPGICDIETACFSIPWSEQSIRDFLRNTDRSFCIVARWGTRILGYLGFLYVLDEGDICNIGVLPEFQRQGVARGLMRKLIEMAESRGISTIHLEVRAGNTRAISLYESVGFQMNGRRLSYYSDTGEDALLYVYQNK